ncbi:MAG TPA: hypothetical protein VER04_15050, partial [Polyangiaceae bacterium]|nr:hypothetical protein [Polyangiaceae bacterium]
AMLLNGSTCRAAILCSDGKFQQTGRCDFQFDCSDGGDERGCLELLCGDKLIDAFYACDPQVCPAPSMPPFCIPDDPTHFLCGEGTPRFVGGLCNDVAECADGRDEQYCFASARRWASRSFVARSVLYLAREEAGIRRFGARFVRL